MYQSGLIFYLQALLSLSTGRHHFAPAKICAIHAVSFDLIHSCRARINACRLPIVVYHVHRGLSRLTLPASQLQVFCDVVLKHIVGHRRPVHIQ
jgi:hypothetical protein